MVFADGIHDFTTAFRVDNPSRPGCKQIICGDCVPETDASDLTKRAGHYKCERCGKEFGTQTAFARAEKIMKTNQERIDALSSEIKDMRENLKYADHGAYGQDCMKIDRLEMELSELQKRAA